MRTVPDIHLHQNAKYFFHAHNIHTRNKCHPHFHSHNLAYPHKFRNDLSKAYSQAVPQQPKPSIVFSDISKPNLDQSNDTMGDLHSIFHHCHSLQIRQQLVQALQDSNFYFGEIQQPIPIQQEEYVPCAISLNFHNNIHTYGRINPDYVSNHLNDKVASFHATNHFPLLEQPSRIQMCL